MEISSVLCYFGSFSKNVWEIYPLIKEIRWFQSMLKCCSWNLIKIALECFG
ncbi:hypothetical protein RchiOBHm_Chr6g0283151 [Rosa chinensis]|uniref:Uncharacterized protein n=1 Tax=Rosa chinensis TaxID=74649 RepID=A0A2P6PU07_ROSCH|nr:hypothetical protein RchiOBHm_Chr6g0283151 [Rosa chinensis]